MLSKSMNTAILSRCSADMNKLLLGLSTRSAVWGGEPTSGVTGGRDAFSIAGAAWPLQNRKQEFQNAHVLHSKEVNPRRRRGKNNFRPHRGAGCVRLVRSRGRAEA